MKKRFLALSLMALVLSACGEYAGKPADASGTAVPAGLETEEKQFSYVVGYELAQVAQIAELEKAGIVLDYKVMVNAMKEQVAGKEPKLTPQQAQKVFQSIGQKVEEAAEKEAAAANAANQKFFDENKNKEGIHTTDSGLQYKINQTGSGVQAKLGDMVAVEYEGRLLDGTIFDSSEKYGGKPVDFALVEGAIIPGWLEALSLMKEGDEYTVYLPANLGYGMMSPSPDIPANSALVFDIKLVKVTPDGAKAK